MSSPDKLVKSKISTIDFPKVTRSLPHYIRGEKANRPIHHFNPTKRVYKLLTDRGKKEVARPLTNPLLGGEGRQTRENLQEEKERLLLFEKEVPPGLLPSQPFQTTPFRRKRNEGRASRVYKPRSFDEESGQFSIPTECPRCISPVSVIALHKSWRGVEPMRAPFHANCLQVASSLLFLHTRL